MLHPIVLAISLSLAVAAGAQAPAKAALPGANNVTRVDAVLMCGGATTKDAYPALKKEGFVSVINLRQAEEPGADIEGSRAAAAAAGLKYIHIPVNGRAPETANVDQFLQAVTDKGNQPMYIHCASANRVGAMWMIKRMLVDGWDAQRAGEEAAAIGLTSAPLKQFALDYAAKHRKQ
jgi:uncharacterized protein (TIGR01244 family)